MSRNINLPFSDLINNFFARKPKDVDGLANQSAIYYRNKLLRLLFQRFEFTGIPGAAFLTISASQIW